MARLVYSAIASLDGFVEDDDGGFGWAAPDEEVHAFVNELERSVGTYLYGRRMHELMAAWETMDTGPGQPPAVRGYARLWRAADKVVYSTTLQAASTPLTILERDFDPEAVRRFKATADRDVSVGGPELAGQALGAELVDEVRLFLVPHLVGGGIRALPAGVRLRLELLDERRFSSGVVYLRYRVAV